MTTRTKTLPAVAKRMTTSKPHAKNVPPGTVDLPRLCSPFRVKNALWALSLGCLSCLGAPSALAAPAGKSRSKRPTPIAVRIAQGQVINNAKQPVEGAVVYLEDPTSLAIKSYLSDNTGHFHFAQLQAQTDYEVWAEQNGVQSKHKFISQFSSHTHFNFTLKLTPEHKKKLGFL